MFIAKNSYFCALEMRSPLRIVSLDITTLSYEESIRQILAWGKARKSSYVCFSNVHMNIEAHDDPAFQKQVNAADLVCADGMPLVKASALLYKKNIERVAGMDMMPSLIERAAAEGVSVYFFGTSDEMLEQIVAKAQQEFPALEVAGSFSPPFKTLSEEEKQMHRQQIIDSKAQLVFVALGCPKQEKWMAENTAELPAVLLGVGGAFPVYINAQKRAPTWIRSISMEWAYRLAQDPKRLFKRYFYTNSKFLYLLLKQYLSPRS